jgi:plasmid stability protein
MGLYSKSVRHQLGDMKKVTITLDEDVARWARIRAAERETSVSRLIGELLKQEMLGEKAYETAMQQYLRRPAEALKWSAGRYPRRDKLHKR